MYGDLISEPASKRGQRICRWSEEGLEGRGGSLDVLNESASLLLPEDVAETDSSAKRRQRQPVAD